MRVILWRDRPMLWCDKPDHTRIFSFSIVKNKIKFKFYIIKKKYDLLNKKRNIPISWSKNLKLMGIFNSKRRKIVKLFKMYNLISCESLYLDDLSWSNLIAFGISRKNQDFKL